MQIEVDGDVAIVTLAVALRAYGLQLEGCAGALRVTRGAGAEKGDQLVRHALSQLQQRAQSAGGVHG